MLWRDNREVSIQNFSQRYISAKITLLRSEFSWQLTGFYGQPNLALREESWKLLSYLGSINSMDWLYLRDFNEVLDSIEKYGGNPKSFQQLEPFRNVVEECRLGDLGFKGSKFTWCNYREGNEFIKERLDRALATPGWCYLFPNVEVEVLAAQSSDHKPLWVRLTQSSGHHSRSFKYEASWDKDVECVEVIKTE
jgi:hypothetical protein